MYSINSKLNVRLGVGALAQLADEVKAMGFSRPIIVTDAGVAGAGLLDKVRAAFPGNTAPESYDRVPENPTFAGVDETIETCRAAYDGMGADAIIALGGGSVMDTAKAAATCLGHDAPLKNFLGHPERITSAVLPMIAIPTTAGTGSEASWGAGIHPDASSRGVGLRSAHIQPKLAICDPELTVTLPPLLTASTGMDALTHCLEAYLSANAHPVGQTIALDGIRRVVANVEAATSNGSDLVAREQMMIAALNGGIAIWMGLGPAHGIANTFGDQGFNHGMLVTLAMPAYLRFMGEHAAERLEPVAEAIGLPVGRRSGAEAADAIAELSARLGLPENYSAMGYKLTDLEDAVEDATNSFFNVPASVKPNADQYRHMILETMAA